MACASHTSLVITHSFKGHVKEITFNKDLLAASQDLQCFCKIFWSCVFLGFFLRRENKEKV